VSSGGGGAPLPRLWGSGPGNPSPAGSPGLHGTFPFLPEPSSGSDIPNAPTYGPRICRHTSDGSPEHAPRAPGPLSLRSEGWSESLESRVVRSRQPIVSAPVGNPPDASPAQASAQLPISTDLPTCNSDDDEARPGALGGGHGAWGSGFPMGPAPVGVWALPFPHPGMFVPPPMPARPGSGGSLASSLESGEHPGELPGKVSLPPAPACARPAPRSPRALLGPW